jgi:BirA family biotin operon repressor/biotin-[acetyl-CoA-carboxylase] ligase
MKAGLMGQFSFLAALALHDTVSQFLPGFSVSLKWPNDVLVDGRKIGGILLEAEESWLIVGIGLNVHQHPKNSLFPSTSLVDAFNQKAGGNVPSYWREGLAAGTESNSKGVPIAELSSPTPPSRGGGTDHANFDASYILDQFLTYLTRWYSVAKAQGFAPIRTAWLEQAHKGTFSVRLPNETVQGTFAGLDENGSLRLRLADGSERAIASGDVFAMPKE